MVENLDSKSSALEILEATRRRQTLVLALTALLGWVCGCDQAAEDRVGADGQYIPAPEGELNFAEHIAPIIHENCSNCHREDQNAPFTLLTYADVKKRAKQVGEVVASGFMPPWLPDNDRGVFINDRRLSAGERGALLQWIEEGAPEGPKRKTPEPPEWPDSEWRLGEPDLIVEMPRPYTLAAEGPDVYRNFVIPVDLSEMRYVQTFEFEPVNRPIVHHAVIQVDASGNARALDEEDEAVGFPGIMPLSAAHLPDGHFLGWTPGREPDPGAEGVSWRLFPGTDLVLQLHLQPTGKPEVIQSRIGLYFTDTPPEYDLYALVTRSKQIQIPANEENYVLRRSYPLPVDVNVLSVYPHAHYLGKSLKGTAYLPDGKSVNLINIPEWDFNWQDEYQYTKPKFLPKGTIIEIDYRYDNSTNNVLNPNIPPVEVTYGQSSTDEMGELMLQVVTKNEADLETLDQHSRRTAQQDEIDWLREKLQTQPEDLEAHNQLAVLLTQTGAFEAASRHLDHVIQTPETESNVSELAFAASALGELLAVAGDHQQAINYYRMALPLRERANDSKGLGQTHLKLGESLFALGRETEAAREHLERAVELRPEDPLAANTLAGYLLTLGPKNPETSELAERHALRAVELTSGLWDPALESLAIARHRLGLVDQALQILDRAILVAEQQGLSDRVASLADVREAVDSGENGVSREKP